MGRSTRITRKFHNRAQQQGNKPASSTPASSTPASSTPASSKPASSKPASYTQASSTIIRRRHVPTSVSQPKSNIIHGRQTITGILPSKFIAPNGYVSQSTAEARIDSEGWNNFEFSTIHRTKARGHSITYRKTERVESPNDVNFQPSTIYSKYTDIDRKTSLHNYLPTRKEERYFKAQKANELKKKIADSKLNKSAPNVENIPGVSGFDMNKMTGNLWMSQFDPQSYTGKSGVKGPKKTNEVFDWSFD